VGNFAIVMVDGVVVEFTQVVVEAYNVVSWPMTVVKSFPPRYSLPFDPVGGTSKILKSDREFTSVFGTAADAGDATDVAPTNSPAHSAPITLFLRINMAISLWFSLEVVYPWPCVGMPVIGGI
jgi:hypothetical protein